MVTVQPFKLAFQRWSAVAVTVTVPEAEQFAEAVMDTFAEMELIVIGRRRVPVPLVVRAMAAPPEVRETWKLLAVWFTTK